jgi:hypothetical protein
MSWKDDVWGVKQPFKFGTGEIENGKSKKVYFEFSLKMKPEWFTWHPNAKDRFVRHFQRKHASDTYQGNIDFDVYATDWDRKGVFGEGTFIVPAMYTEDIKTKSDYKEVAEDALSTMMEYDLSYQERDLIDDYKIDKITT